MSFRQWSTVVFSMVTQGGFDQNHTKNTASLMTIQNHMKKGEAGIAAGCARKRLAA
jgi:hypothetical protein